MITLTATAAGQKVHLRAVSDEALPVISITRTMAGVTKPVRGASGAEIAVLTLDDFEVVYGVDLIYTATDGVNSATATVKVDESRAWLRSVLLPELSIPVWIASHAEATRNARSVLLRPVGRRNPVAITDVRSGQSGSTALYTWDDAGHQGMLQLMADGGVLLLTGPGEWRLGPLYMLVGDITESRPGNLADTAIRRWQCDWVEVDPPPGDVPAEKRDFQEIIDDIGTFADLKRYTFADALYEEGVPTAP